MYRVYGICNNLVGIYKDIEDFIRTYYFNEKSYEDWKAVMREDNKDFDEINCRSLEDFVQEYLADAKINTLYDMIGGFEWDTYVFYKI